MVHLTRTLYSFLGVHSFLIGVFPFYIPVYLYTDGYSLRSICYFVAVTGAGFCISLYVWDRISKIVSLRYLIAFSVFSEFVLLTSFFLEKGHFFILICGFLNGVFNCNFWIIQRLLFLDTISFKNSGRKFGNFQLFVMVILKIGILLGGVLLEKTGYLSLYLFSASIVLVAAIFFLQKGKGIEFEKKLVSAEPLSLKTIICYRDRINSRLVFAVDGVFLYLESYFWLISLFLLVQQSYLKLGLLVMFLTLFFGIIFVIIKNSIDRLPIGNMYKGAVLLYFASWILRGVFAEGMGNIQVLLMLAVISFCTSLFRLVFNKSFFDNAKTTTVHKYIFIKSYWSQFFMAVLFGIIGSLMLIAGDVAEQLSTVYFLAALFSFVYLLFRHSNR